MINIPKIIKVIPGNNLMLEVFFSDGVIKKYDCKKIKSRCEYFYRLENFSYFKNVSIDAGGYGVSWDNDID